MKTKEIQPDEVLFNSLLDGCSKNNKTDLAFKLYE
jgi:pentatricopeptide repeat protein